MYPTGYGINCASRSLSSFSPSSSSLTLLALFVVADLAGNQVIKFGIESKVSCKETSTEVFRRNLTEALREMRQACEEGQPAPARGQEGASAGTAKL